ncbi:MAG TPA: chemotaxis protein CheD [Bacillota bacterium]|nr:chemotaxis protein CheD [Bacillota bacterium]
MSNLQDVVKVGIADLNFVKAPNIIRTSGLGSCVGVVVYDLARKTAGLAHIMLPDSKQAKQAHLNKYKYADTAIDIMIERLSKNGARRNALQAKMAGGAEMFQFTSASDIMRIGPRNIEAVRSHLQKHRIPLIAEDVGGCSGRTIEFNPASGALRIRTVNKGETTI